MEISNFMFVIDEELNKFERWKLHEKMLDAPLLEIFIAVNLFISDLPVDITSLFYQIID